MQYFIAPCLQMYAHMTVSNSAFIKMYTLTLTPYITVQSHCFKICINMS